MVDVDQHGRLVVVAGAGGPFAAGQRARAVGEGIVYLALDDRGLVGRGHRADVLRFARVVGALADAADLLHQLVDELVVGGLLHVDALDRDADLARVRGPPAPGGGVGGAVEVGVGEHDHRFLAAEPQADRGERLSGTRHHLAAGPVGAGEPDESTAVDQGAAGLADPLDAVEDVGAADLLLPGLDDLGEARAG